MRPVLTIVKRELSAYFTSPVAYVFLVIFLLLTGFFTFTAGNFFERGEASLAAFFGWHPWIYLMVVPAIGMRSVRPFGLGPDLPSYCFSSARSRSTVSFFRPPYASSWIR